MKTTKCKECEHNEKVDELIEEGLAAGFNLEQIHYLVKYFI